MERLHTIPNSLNLLLAGAYYAYAVAAGLSGAEILEHTLTAVGVLVLMAIAAASGVYGAGVGKLVAVAFLWFGFGTGLTFFAVSMTLCGATGYLVQAVRGQEVLMPYLPFAAIAAGLIVGVPHLGPLMGG